jgi:hypothetical protein
VVAASPVLSALSDQERAYGVPRASRAGPVVAMNLELVTLTETTAILTWFTGDPTQPDAVGRPRPVPADSEVLLGTSPLALRSVHHDAGLTPFHYVELTGLEPGQTYFYVPRSGGAPALPAAFAAGNPVGTSTLGSSVTTPYIFTTPHPPPGRPLFAIALCNDLHVGETVAGLIGVGGRSLTPGVTQVAGEPPYTAIMVGALPREARGRGADLLLAAGDITSEARPAELASAKSYLDSFGLHGRDYLLARGNHDRPHSGTEYGACRLAAGSPDHHDCFREVWFPDRPTWFAADAFGLRILGLDTYDKIGNGSDNGVLSPEQFAFVGEQLNREPDRPTLVLGHHPVNLEASITTLEPLLFDLQPAQGIRLEQLYAKSPGVFLHHCGHTHRNKRTLSLIAPGVAFQEVAAVKEYPGGFHLLRVFTGGYALNFYKFRDPLALEWSERTRQEDFGAFPYYTAGSVSDRNFVASRDLSGLQPAPARNAGSTATAPPQPLVATGGQSSLADTGGDPRLPLAGGVALTAGLAAEAWLRRQSGRS